LESSIQGGGDVTISPTPNADTLNLFKAGEVDGAWLPEPWASRLVLEAGAEVLVDERDLWPDGEFVTTHLIVRTEFLEEYPGTVAALLRGHVAAVQFANDDAEAAKASFNEGMVASGSDEVPTDVLDRAWDGLTATYDPIASALEKSAEDGFKAGTSETEVDLDGIYDLRLLNEILGDQDLEPVSAGGLGED
jgi:NitT/TauT family transport system substrate-binding protein